MSQAETIRHLAIIAGGQGTRLASIAGDLPKVLVPVCGRSVLERQLDAAAACGIEEVSIFAGYRADQIADCCGNGERFGLKVRVFIEQEPKGNAGAFLESLDSLPNDSFVLYGDAMFAVDLQRMAKRHLESHADFTTFVHPNDHPQDSDLLEVDPRDYVTAIHTYPHPQGRYFSNLVNAGLYIVRRDALRPFAALPGKVDFVKDVMARLISSGRPVVAYRSNEYIKDMGTPARLQKVEADWRAGRISTHDAEKRRPAVFLDRDGTLAAEKGHMRTPDALEVFPTTGKALQSLRQAGFSLVVLTNQPVVARGEATEEDVAEIHRRLEWELGAQGAFLDGIYVCHHHPDRGFAGERTDLKKACECRKPATGLFESACRDLQIDKGKSWMVGDQTRDIEMARRAGLRSVLVRTGLAGSDHAFQATPDYIVDDLHAAARLIREHHEAAIS